MKISRRVFICLLAIVVGLIATSCSSIGKYPGDSGLPGGQVSIGSSKLPPPVKEVDNRIVSANTKFGLKLFNELIAQEPDKNVFICPTSIAMALAMTYNGADGATKDAMAKTLELEGIDIEVVNKANADLKTILENPDPHVQLSIANSLWAREGMSFEQEFLDTNRKFYGAQVQELDFNSSEAGRTINDWVKKHTKDKIEKIVEDNIEPDTIMFLINALYFKGSWANKFDPKLTRKETFFLRDGTEKSYPMMFQSGEEYPYYKGENFQAVSLPYGKGRVSMMLFLPDEGVNLQEFCEGITLEKWEEWMNSFSDMEGEVGLPKFKVEYEVELKETLKALGMEIAFDEKKADFEKMYSFTSRGNIFIGSVKHKTFVETNEEGTEAAGATSVEMKLRGAPIDTFRMIIDRPFFFVIRDNETGTVLFMGTITDPMAGVK